MAPRLPELIKRARRLATERDRLVQELAREWSAALRGQGFSPRDLDELWAGLTEDAVRRLLRARAESASPEAIRRESSSSLALVSAEVEDAFIFARAMVLPGVRIGAGAWVGSGAVVLADVGRDTVVGAGAVVTKPLPDRVLAAGVPARVLRRRDEPAQDASQ